MVSASDAAAAGRCLIQSARRLMCQNSNMLKNTRRILAVALLAAIVSSNSDRSKYSPRKVQPVLELKVDGASISLDVRAHDVQLGLRRDRNHTPILDLTSARDGIARCDTTTSDLSRMFRASADFRGRPYGLRVQRARLSLISDNNHQIKADLSLASRLLLMPISLHFTARVDVDDAGNAHLSNLTCRGDDIAGWLISGFIRPE